MSGAGWHAQWANVFFEWPVPEPEKVPGTEPEKVPGTEHAAIVNLNRSSVCSD